MRTIDLEDKVLNLKEDVRSFLGEVRKNIITGEISWKILKLRLIARYATYKKLFSELKISGNLMIAQEVYGQLCELGMVEIILKIYDEKKLRK